MSPTQMETVRSDRQHWRMSDEPGEDRISNILEQMPGLLLTTDPDLRITLAAGADLDRLQWRPHQVLGLTIEEFKAKGRTFDPHGGLWSHLPPFHP